MVLIDSLCRSTPFGRKGSNHVTFNPRLLAGPRLIDLEVSRYYQLRDLKKAIERRPSKPTELLCEVSRRLPRTVVEQLRAILEGGVDSVSESLIETGRLEMSPDITEDAFLALAWLELADQALEEEEPGPLGLLVALQPVRDESNAEA
jgi:hypothetical protein